MTPDSKKQGKPGRRSAISDEDLHKRCRVLAGILERCWCDVGWRLYSTKEPKEVGAIIELCSEKEHYPGLTSFSAITVDPPATGPEVKELIKSVRDLEIQNQEARTTYDQHLALLEKTQKALTEAEGRSEIKSVERLLALRQKEFERSRNQQIQSDTQLKEMRENLDERRASFSQEELFMFIKSTDSSYKFSPKNLAKVAAGLPFIKWRQSLLRCSKFSDTRSSQIDYCVFQALERVLARADLNSSATDAVATLEKEILILHKKSKIDTDLKVGSDYLAHHWRPLKTVIAKTWGLGAMDCLELPYSVGARFLHKVRSRKTLDQVLDEDERLRP